MSKVRGPLGSISASGTFGKSFIYQNWKGIPRVKRYKKPKQPNNAAQLDKRSIMSRAIIRWQGLSDELKKLWGEYNYKAMSGYNYFLSEYIHWTCQNYVPSDDPRVPPTPPGPPPPPPGPITDELISWWKFDEGAGDYIADSYGSNHGTRHGASWVDGKIGKALDFNGSSDYVDVGNINPSGSISIEAWIKLQATGANLMVFGNSNNSTIGWFIDFRKYNGDGDTLFKHFGLTPNGTYDLTFLEEDYLDTWAHFVFIWDSDLMKTKFYIDTDKKAENNISSGTNITPGLKMAIGCMNATSPSFHFNGIIDEVRIYNKALNQSEINNNFNLS